MGVSVCVTLSVCECVGVIVWARRGVNGWGSLDCSSPLRKCVCVSFCGCGCGCDCECVGVTVSVCVGVCGHTCVGEEGREFESLDCSSPLSVFLGVRLWVWL